MQAKMNPVVEGTATETDAVYLRRAIAMAQTARDKGHHPFGALVVLDGEILGEAHSLKVKDRDGTNHSEMQALKAASAKHPPSVLVRAEALVHSAAAGAPRLVHRRPGRRRRLALAQLPRQVLDRVRLAGLGLSGAVVVSARLRTGRLLC